MMKIKLIKTAADYEAALKEINRLFDADPDTPDGDRLEVFVTLVEAYEAKHHPVPLPDPIEAIEHHMERLGLTRKDLEPCIGSRARVADILNRRRPLTLNMIRKLEDRLGIPAAVLVQKYTLADNVGKPTAKPTRPAEAPCYFQEWLILLAENRSSGSTPPPAASGTQLPDNAVIASDVIAVKDWPTRDNCRTWSAIHTTTVVH